MQVRLYQVRKESKLSQEDTAEYLGITRATYGKKERGEVPFTIDEMFALKELFGMNLEDIFLPRGNRVGY